LASILWYAALPIGIQASIDRNTHNAFLAESPSSVLQAETWRWAALLVSEDGLFPG
jgi:hypothetical protein